MPTTLRQPPLVFDPAAAAAPTARKRLGRDKRGMGRPDTSQAAQARDRVRWVAGFPIRPLPVGRTSAESARLFEIPVPTALRQPLQAFNLGRTASSRKGIDKRGSGHADALRAAKAGTEAKRAAGLPLRPSRTFRTVVRHMDWTPGIPPTPPRPPSPLLAVSRPAPTGPDAILPGVRGNQEHQALSAGIEQEDGGTSGLAAEPAPPPGPVPSTAEPAPPTDYMEGVEEAILLPQEWPAAELVALARSFVEDIVLGIVTPRQVDQAIHHVIAREPYTWQEALDVRDCASCPHNLQVALRTYMEDVCPNMRQGVDEEELGPDPSQAYPSPPTSLDRPSSPPQSPATVPPSASSAARCPTPRRSSRQRCKTQAWWQTVRDPAPEGRGEPS